MSDRVAQTASPKNARWTGRRGTAPDCSARPAGRGAARWVSWAPMKSNASRGLSALFRTSVAIGCFALLLGVAGIFYFDHKDREARARRSPDEALVLVSGSLASTVLEIQVAWRSRDGEEAETGRPGPEAASWRFTEAPEGVPVELRLYGGEEGARRLIARHPVVLTRGAVFELVLRSR